jgi:TonB family protein
MTSRVNGLLTCVMVGALAGAEQSVRTSCVGKPSADTAVYDTTQLTEVPQRRGGPPPRYPESARTERVQGKVVIGAIVEANGSVNRRSLVVLEGADPRLNRASERLVRLSRFWPGCRDGMAVRVRIVVPVEWAMGPAGGLPN